MCLLGSDGSLSEIGWEPDGPAQTCEGALGQVCPRPWAGEAEALVAKANYRLCVRRQEVGHGRTRVRVGGAHVAAGRVGVPLLSNGVMESLVRC